MSAEFVAIKEKIRSSVTGKAATRTIYVNLDAILYVEDDWTPGEPIRIYCSDKRSYSLVNEEAEQLIRRLNQRCKP